MNLNHLKYFFDTASMKSLSMAAKRNRVSQSAISQAIRALEGQLNCQLIFHKKNRFQLTEAGEVTFHQCQQVFLSLEMMKEKVVEQEGDFSGEVRFGCINSVASILLPEVLTQLQEEFPKLRIKLRLGNSETIQQWIYDREIDLGFVVDTFNPKVFERVLVRSGVYSLFLLPGMGRSLEEKGIIVTRRERPEVEDLLRAYRDHTGTDLKIHMEVTSWEVIKRLVLSGVGIGLCPEYVISKEVRDQKLRRIRLPYWKYPYQIDALQLKNREIPKGARLLLSRMLLD